ncbi:MAG: sulfatase [Lentisphaeria bacterium]|nr:sulfatase [Lentisphaeria bacterium]
MNVILVMSDSFRRDHIGAFGNPWIRTPALNRFAAQSTVFPHFRMGSYATIPQRTDMLTGRFSFAYRPWQRLEREDVVLTEVLAKHGLATYCAADTPHLFRSAELTFLRGFDGFHWSRGSEGDIWWTDYYNEQAFTPPTGKGRVRFSPERYRPLWSQGQRRVSEMDWVTPQTFQAAIEWLTRNSRRESFFLYVDTFDPHEPWDPPRWARDLYLPDAEGIPYAWAEYGAASQYGADELRHLQSLYAGECTIVDRWFGRLMDTVDLLGLADRTMVVFISDHGHYLGYPNDGGQVGKHTGYRSSDGKMAGADADVFTPLLDSVSNPPFLVRLPGQTAGRSCPALAQPADLMPTVLDFLGLDVPETVQGTSILPLLGGSSMELRNTAVTACHRSFAQISDARWLYGLWPFHNPPRLYDRRADPEQRVDVFAQHPDQARQLHQALMAEMQRLEAPAEWISKLQATAGASLTQP